VCTGLSGATPEQRILRANGHLQAHSMRARSAQKTGTPILAHRTLNSTCPVCTGHPGEPTSQKLQRSESNGTSDVARAPDMSGVHRTVRCAIEQTASTNGQVGGWGYKYPNHPTIHCIQVSTSQPLTRARHSILDTHKEIKSSPIPHKALKISERDLPCSFKLLRLDCFFSFSLVLVIKTPL
jgi:hypothetical protein